MTTTDLATAITAVLPDPYDTDAYRDWCRTHNVATDDGQDVAAVIHTLIAEAIAEHRDAQIHADGVARIRTAVVAALRDMADRIDRGPSFALPPSVISALVRERAQDLEDA